MEGAETSSPIESLLLLLGFRFSFAEYVTRAFLKAVLKCHYSNTNLPLYQKEALVQVVGKANTLICSGKGEMVGQ
ncbi:hypothetical protein HHK36_028255 [Tetracentron sinense]|uniref:Uncharacterized protein n=1 Tax=Tetracentron sinense TaxID=13715 RepID=A0A834YI55_TETSI|nr:hypothetical protein HHK36_028255 [Tetracentron sinense]